MIQSPKPAKPVLHLPQLEASRRILIYFNLPYLDSQALKLQQLFFLQIKHDLSTFQTIKKVPRKLSYPLKPSTVQIQEEHHLHSFGQDSHHKASNN
ncbi:hypothetical protein IGI04_002134 [Brassica rapa subsp. trilocularis]|uniref:Uncharacterized protein n=1 Tax=Brassica rapa subsp. trilocularis TaxID=1813537 RepID=A0ABQ7NUM1_BRACM|nr:hypothetical protein IGI04_002134 [Brassica rapa subsp. trilocularis]